MLRRRRLQRAGAGRASDDAEHARPGSTSEDRELAVPVPWVVSGRSEQALRAQAERLIGPVVDLASVDVGHSLLARAAMEHRAVVFGSEREALLGRARRARRGGLRTERGAGELPGRRCGVRLPRSGVAVGRDGAGPSRHVSGVPGAAGRVRGGSVGVRGLVAERGAPRRHRPGPGRRRPARSVGGDGLAGGDVARRMASIPRRLSGTRQERSPPLSVAQGRCRCGTVRAWWRCAVRR